MAEGALVEFRKRVQNGALRVGKRAAQAFAAAFMLALLLMTAGAAVPVFLGVVLMLLITGTVVVSQLCSVVSGAPWTASADYWRELWRLPKPPERTFGPSELLAPIRAVRNFGYWMVVLVVGLAVQADVTQLLDSGEADELVPHLWGVFVPLAIGLGFIRIVYLAAAFPFRINRVQIANPEFCRRHGIVRRPVITRLAQSFRLATAVGIVISLVFSVGLLVS